METQWFKDRLKFVKATQKDIAQAIGRDRTVVSRIISGRNPMRLEFLYGFASTLGVTAREVAGRAGMDLPKYEDATEGFIGTPGQSPVDAAILTEIFELVDDVNFESGLDLDRHTRLRATAVLYAIYDGQQKRPDREQILVELVKICRQPGAPQQAPL